MYRECTRYNSPNLSPNPAVLQETETKCKNWPTEWETGQVGRRSRVRDCVSTSQLLEQGVSLADLASRTLWLTFPWCELSPETRGQCHRVSVTPAPRYDWPNSSWPCSRSNEQALYNHWISKLEWIIEPTFLINKETTEWHFKKFKSLHLRFGTK